MVVLSDCLTSKIDEGCLKVANSLTKRLKVLFDNTIIVSYDRKPDYSDVHLSPNRLFLNLGLLSLVRKNEPLVYIPFASNTTASCMRTFILSCFSRKKVNVLFVLRFPMKPIAKLLLKLSGARVIALSKVSYEFYREVVGNNAFYLKTGVDTKKFVPVTDAKKTSLREKYQIPADKKVLLHVGHLKAGRNVDKLFGADKQFYIVLVISSVTEAEKDTELRKKLESRGNITIIDFYLEHVEEVYQMADVYLFPVQEMENCIDVPLSVLEAAACNTPIVTTEYGELASFRDKEGFLFLNNLQLDVLNPALNWMAAQNNVDTRSAVTEYDWDCSIRKLQKLIGE